MIRGCHGTGIVTLTLELNTSVGTSYNHAVPSALSSGDIQHWYQVAGFSGPPLAIFRSVVE